MSNAPNVLKEATSLTIGSAVLMILLGMLAIALPAAMGLGVALVVAWIIIFGGISHFVYAFAAEGAGQVVWRFLVGVVYILGGIYLAFHPGLSLATLTLLLGAIFIVEGVMRAVLFFQLRTLPRAGWILFDSLMTLLLGVLIIGGWPTSSAWAIGTIVGVNLLVSGFTRLMLSVAARKAINAAAHG
ncbi:MAG TPA: DUF308 domain-containing protein [Anaeromyxobacteraceae bacterium]|nr:DUF308 domain-containing protein [Anaeromyxobacteraceae bacterium]